VAFSAGGDGGRRSPELPAIVLWPPDATVASMNKCFGAK